VKILVYQNDSKAIDSQLTRLEVFTIYTKSHLWSRIIFQNVAGNFVKGSLQGTSGFLWLAYVEENFEMGVRRAIRLLEQASLVESIISAEER
jgi:hypothetical protein